MDARSPYHTSTHMALLDAVLTPRTDTTGAGADGGIEDGTGPTAPQSHHHQTPQTVHSVAPPAQGGAADRGENGTTAVVAANSNGDGEGSGGDRAITPTSVLNPRSFTHDDTVDAIPQGYGISYDPPLSKIVSGRLMARVVRVEFDPAHLKSTTAEKALAVGIDQILPESARNSDGFEKALVRQYERILNHAEYISRRRTALQAFEEEMDVGTAICLAEAAKRDPQYAAVRRRLRQIDDRYRVRGDQSTQFSQLMDFLRGIEPTLPTAVVGGMGNGNEQSEGGEGAAGNNDGDDAWPSGLREGGDEQESE